MEAPEGWSGPDAYLRGHRLGLTVGRALRRLAGHTEGMETEHEDDCTAQYLTDEEHRCHGECRTRQ